MFQFNALVDGRLSAMRSITLTRALIQKNIFERGTVMKYILAFSILAALLGGCAVGPGFGDDRGGYYRDYDYNRGNAYYRDSNYRGERGNAADPFQEPGH
jgi:hypothetical protein